MVTAVKVPKQFEPTFEAAEKRVKDFFRQLEFEPQHGTIGTKSDRYILLRGASISVEFFQLCRNLFGEENQQEADLFASNFLYELAHALGKSDAKSFAEKMELEDPIEKLSAGALHFSYTGWAFVDILDESSPTADENYFLAYKHPYSFESEAWQDSTMTPHSPVCIMNSGYSSGWCEESFGLNLEARELTCRALGHENCHFVMAPTNTIDKRVEEYLKKHELLRQERKGMEAAQLDPSVNLDLEYGSKESFTHLLSHRLFTYSRNLETARDSLTQKVEQLNQEMDSRLLTESRLKDSEKRWHDLSDMLFDSILVVNDDRIVYANQASSSLFRMPLERILEGSISDLIEQKNWMLVQEKLSSKKSHVVELEIKIENRIAYVELQLHQSGDEYVFALRDISHQVRASQELENLANTDSLTGLPNRMAFERIVKRRLSSSHDLSAMLFLDLDKFKKVNDTMGHKAGDLLLFEVAQRTQSVIRAGDLLARLGGDEFGIWLPGLDNAMQAEFTARRILEALGKPFLIYNSSIQIAFSIGISYCPEHGVDFSTLQTCADKAMYKAKGDGGDRFFIFNDSIES